MEFNKKRSHEAKQKKNKGESCFRKGKIEIKLKAILIKCCMRQSRIGTTTKKKTEPVMKRKTTQEHASKHIFDLLASLPFTTSAPTCCDCECVRVCSLIFFFFFVGAVLMLVLLLCS